MDLLVGSVYFLFCLFFYFFLIAVAMRFCILVFLNVFVRLIVIYEQPDVNLTFIKKLPRNNFHCYEAKTQPNEKQKKP